MSFRPEDQLRETSLDSSLPKAPISAVAQLLVGRELDVEIPSLAELTGATTALAVGTRNKALLPLPGTPIEFALVRRGDFVLISCYGTGSAPVVYQLDRRVSLRLLLDTCASATLDAARLETDPTARQIAVRVADRARRTAIAEHASDSHTPVDQRGGAMEAPGEEVPIAFGFEASIFPHNASSASRSTRADVHALLFEGALWAFVRGKRVTLAQGPIMLAAHRMVVAVRTLVDAWIEGRPTQIKLRAGSFVVALRLSRAQEVSIDLGADGKDSASATNLGLTETALPILRLASDILRSLVAADRSQSKNLRVRALRQEVRALRREIQSRRRRDSFVNVDPDRFRMEIVKRASAPDRPEASAAPLRFDERWRISVEGVDANTIFMCGDRLVMTTQNHLLAVSRDSGEVLWARPGSVATTLMAGSVLIRVSPDGDVELCDVADGEPYATTRVTPRIGGPAVGLMAGGGSIPPVAVLTEGSHRLVAIDARTGEPRWRFASRTGGEFRLKRAGRILLVACGEGALHALDIATGEDVWRFSEGGLFRFRPAICREVAVAVANRGRHAGEIFGIDLYTGEPLWSEPLNGAPSTPPQAAGRWVIQGAIKNGKQTLSACDPTNGKTQWQAADPGVGTGGACLAVDRLLITNAPIGRLSAIDLETGRSQWDSDLADPLADEVPRRLEPILRGGALFVPASSVHVIHPSTGNKLSTTLPCDLVPDLMRVDERGWVYVAEESGYIAAYGPAGPQLQLIPGGKR